MHISLRKRDDYIVLPKESVYLKMQITLRIHCSEAISDRNNYLKIERAISKIIKQNGWFRAL